MSAETVNGYTLLAEPADWSDPPQWSLTWDTEVAGTLRGNEGRSALREMPRPSLKYRVQPLRVDTQARLVAALTAGLASGKCCAPTFGRASWLTASAAAGATVLQIEPTAWAWSVNDWLLLYTDDGGHQVRQITAIDLSGTDLTVAALTAACASESAVYPLLFGRAELSDIQQVNGAIAAGTITLIGDKFLVNQDVPRACRAVALAPFDFAVIRYQWTAGNGDDLDTRTALVTPAVDSDVGYGLLYHVPTGPGARMLTWGGDNRGAGAEAVLVDFAAITAASPGASTIVIRLRATWAGVPVDGDINVQFATYRGGTMASDGAYDFINAGGVAASNVNVARHVGTRPYLVPAVEECGTLVYTPSTRTAIILPP